MQLLTGQEAHEHTTADMSVDEIKAELTQAASQGSPIVGGTNPHQDAGNGLSGRHAYMVTYNSETNQVTLTNPNKPGRHGATEPGDRQQRPLDGNNDGSFVMSLEKFKENFRAFHSTAQPAKAKVASTSENKDS